MASLKYNTYLNIAYVTAGAEKKPEKLLIVTLILGENIFFLKALPTETVILNV